MVGFQFSCVVMRVMSGQRNFGIAFASLLVDLIFRDEIGEFLDGDVGAGADVEDLAACFAFKGCDICADDIRYVDEIAPLCAIAVNNQRFVAGTNVSEKCPAREHRRLLAVGAAHRR